MIVDDLDATEAAVIDLGATRPSAPAWHVFPSVPGPGGPPLLPLSDLIRRPRNKIRHGRRIRFAPFVEQGDKPIRQNKGAMR